MLLQSIIGFLREQINELSFYQEYWPNIQASLLKQISEPDRTLAMQAQRLWLCLGADDPKASKHRALVKCIELMQFDELVSYAKALLARNTFGELVLYTSGKNQPLSPENGIEIGHINEFKARATFFD